jgi:hypothetical protein
MLMIKMGDAYNLVFSDVFTSSVKMIKKKIRSYMIVSSVKLVK